MSVILELNEETIDKIAAGEAIQRPASALKELLENSLDTQSKSIRISLKDAGLTQLSVSDDGTGIHPDDFKILCKRFTTSKLHSIEELGSLATFGFRGEALSSISQVSRLIVCSRKRDLPLGYRGVYAQGELAEAPAHYALEKGTIVSVEKLFYNNQSRLSSCCNTGEENKCCFDVVWKYALQFPDICITLIKDKQKELASLGKGDRIRVIQDSLKHPVFREESIVIPPTHSADHVYSGIISNSRFSLRKSYFTLFINNRLVDSAELRQLIRGVYRSYTAKRHFFTYISITVPADSLDVNIHPSKQTVYISHQSRIFCEIQSRIEDMLKQPPGPPRAVPPVHIENNSLPQCHLYPPAHPEAKIPSESLKSIMRLQQRISPGPAAPIFSNFSYIGALDQGRALISSCGSLYLCLIPAVVKPLIYQEILSHFGSFPGYTVEPPQACPVQLSPSKVALLADYFSITIENNLVSSLPAILPALISPNLKHLNSFLQALSTVNWGCEKDCLDKISLLLSEFYVKLPTTQCEAGLFAVLPQKLTTDPRFIAEGKSHFFLTNTARLYKAFERC